MLEGSESLYRLSYRSPRRTFYQTMFPKREILGSHSNVRKVSGLWHVVVCRRMSIPDFSKDLFLLFSRASTKRPWRKRYYEPSKRQEPLAHLHCVGAESSASEESWTLSLSSESSFPPQSHPRRWRIKAHPCGNTHQPAMCTPVWRHSFPLNIRHQGTPRLMLKCVSMCVCVPESELDFACTMLPTLLPFNFEGGILHDQGCPDVNTCKTFGVWIKWDYS